MTYWYPFEQQWRSFYSYLYRSGLKLNPTNFALVTGDDGSSVRISIWNSSPWKQRLMRYIVRREVHCPHRFKVYNLLPFYTNKRSHWKYLSPAKNNNHLNSDETNQKLVSVSFFAFFSVSWLFRTKYFENNFFYLQSFYLHIVSRITTLTWVTKRCRPP